MINIADPEDLVQLREIYTILGKVLDAPEKYDIVNFEAEKGTSRSEVPGPDENYEHSIQRLGISLHFVRNNGESQ